MVRRCHLSFTRHNFFVVNTYNRIAWAYDKLARVVFGESILRSQTHYLSLLKPNEKILIVGGGSGNVLTFIDELDIPLTIDFVEPSEKMIQRAENRMPLNNLADINFHQATFESYNPQVQYDWVFCFFFLDLFKRETLINHVAHINNLMNTESILWVTDFQIVADSFWQKGLSKIMHVFFKLTTKLESNKLKDINDVLLQSGFANENKAEYFNRFILSALYKKEVS